MSHATGTSLTTALLLLALTGPRAFSQNRPPGEDPFPLRPANTSSPRDTLRTFVDELDFALGAEQQSRLEFKTRRAFVAYARAANTLDFTTTPNNGSPSVRVERVLALKEVLDRLELPPENTIPDARMVEDRGVKRWSIPDSKITIQLVEEGPNAGEFLFSADTVQRIIRYYGYVKELPVREGTVPGIYEDYQAQMASRMEAAGGVRNYLRPIDTTSPRSTFDGFRTNMNRAYEIVMRAETASKADPPAMSMEEARALEAAAETLVGRAVASLDLREVPIALSGDRGVESALRLKEILDRMTPPPIDLIPDREAVAAGRSGPVGRPFRWRYPNTNIEIVESTEGPRQGQFLFSAETVSRLDDMYQRVRDLPYREDNLGPLALEFSSPETSPGFLDYYRSTPGSLIPRASYLGSLVDDLPAWLKMPGGGGQMRWQWISLVVCVVLTVVISVLVRRVLWVAAVRLSNPWDDWVKVLLSLSTAGFVAILIRVLDSDVNFTGDALVVLTNLGWLVVTVFLAVAAWRLCNAIFETLLVLPHFGLKDVRPTPVRLVGRVAGGLTSALIIGTGLQLLGVNVFAIIAGVSIGGLALGLAARSSVENLIGSLWIFADKPYKVGERIVVMGHDGIVEAIGMRSTRIRLLNGHVTSIPNEKMAASDIENIGRRPFIPRQFDITLHFNTPPAKIRQAVEILKELLALPGDPDPDHHNVPINHPDYPPRVYFNSINADSLNIYVGYWYHPADWWAYMGHADAINLQIMERFEAAGIEFSMPSQEVHLIGAGKLPVSNDEVRGSPR